MWTSFLKKQPSYEKIEDRVHRRAGLRRIIMSDVQMDSSIHIYTIIVHLHVTHDSTLTVFYEHLKNIPQAFDLFITIQKDCTHVSINTTELKNSTKAENIIVKSTSEEIDDIASLICGIGEKILSYDLVLHLHTIEDKNAQDFALSHLLPNRLHVERVFALLNQRVGMLAPSYEYCASSNMFWARTDYLKSLLHLNLTIENLSQLYIKPKAHPLENIFLWGRDTGRTFGIIILEKKELSDRQLFYNMFNEIAGTNYSMYKLLSKLLPLIHLGIILLIVLIITGTIMYWGK